MQQHNLRSQIERLKRPIRFSSLNQRAGEDSSLEELQMQAVGTVALMLASEVIDGDLFEEEISGTLSNSGGVKVGKQIQTPLVGRNSVQLFPRSKS